MLIAFTFSSRFLQRRACFKAEICNKIKQSIPSLTIGYPFGDLQNWSFFKQEIWLYTIGKKFAWPCFWQTIPFWMRPSISNQTHPTAKQCWSCYGQETRKSQIREFWPILRYFSGNPPKFHQHFCNDWYHYICRNINYWHFYEKIIVFFRSNKGPVCCAVRGRALASHTGVRRFHSRGIDCLLLFTDHKLRSIYKSWRAQLFGIHCN